MQRCRGCGAATGAGVSPAETAPETFWIAGQAAQDAGFVEAASGPMPLEALVPAGLGTGAWVDLKVQDAWVRAQLTWTSPRGGLYMFISSRGLAHSMTRRTLDRLLGEDALRVVPPGVWSSMRWTRWPCRRCATPRNRPRLRCPAIIDAFGAGPPRFGSRAAGRPHGLLRPPFHPHRLAKGPIRSP